MTATTLEVPIHLNIMSTIPMQIILTNEECAVLDKT